MDASRIAAHSEQLKRRRDEVMMTLQYLDKERRAAEDNTDWLDQAAYESRIALLDRLNDWYVNEIAQIDEAFIRIAENRFGFCQACHTPIDPRRLEINPEASFCTP
ncbi:MAG TPA: TraR/DksA C4-type zinc finger protein, partial [Terriglobales bacterium]|nr:TraR/DksA C4-type zinc finger protein [Terriglobales bacterium]